MDKINLTTLTPSQENYLEWIYRFSEQGEVRVSDIAAKLGVSLPSASRAVKTLSKLGLIRHKLYGKIQLTREGKIAGQAIVRRDQGLTKLLVDVLGMEPNEADVEVHRLEHMVSIKVLQKLEVLTEFALSDIKWLEKLQGQISAHNNRYTESRFGIGETQIHKGALTEKHN